MQDDAQGPKPVLAPHTGAVYSAVVILVQSTFLYLLWNALIIREFEVLPQVSFLTMVAIKIFYDILTNTMSARKSMEEGSNNRLITYNALCHIYNLLYSKTDKSTKGN